MQPAPVGEDVFFMPLDTTLTALRQKLAQIARPELIKIVCLSDFNYTCPISKFFENAELLQQYKRKQLYLEESLRACPIVEAAARLIGARCPLVETVDLSGSDLDRRALCAVLHSFPRLKKIKAKGAAFTGIILSLHAPVLPLESLDISNCVLDGDDIDDELVEQGESLEDTREAEDPRRTGHGIISSLLHVIRAPALLELHCVNSHLGLSDGVLQELTVQTRLHTLMMSANAEGPDRGSLSITDEGITALAAALPHLQTVSLLNGSMDGQCLDRLLCLSQLTELRLSCFSDYHDTVHGNEDSQVSLTLNSPAPRLSTLWLRLLSITHASVLTSIATRLPALERLALNPCSAQALPILVAHTSRLRELLVPSSALSEELIVALGRYCAHLRRLVCIVGHDKDSSRQAEQPTPKISAAALACLSQCTQLAYLHLTEQTIDPPHWAALGKISALRRLGLYALTNSTVPAFLPLPARAFPLLQELSLADDQSFLGATQLSCALALAENIESGSRAGYKNTNFNFPSKLFSTFAPGNNSDEMSEWLTKHRESWRVEGDQQQRKGIEDMMRALSSGEPLERIRVEGLAYGSPSGFRDAQMHCLIDMLRLRPALGTTAVSFTAVYITDKSALALAEVIAAGAFPALTSFSFGMCPVTNNGLAAQCRSLTACPKLERLSLGIDKVSDTTANPAFALFRHCSALSEIRITGNGRGSLITDHSWGILIESLLARPATAVANRVEVTVDHAQLSSACLIRLSTSLSATPLHLTIHALDASLPALTATAMHALATATSAGALSVTLPYPSEAGHRELTWSKSSQFPARYLAIENSARQLPPVAALLNSPAAPMQTTSKRKAFAVPAPAEDLAAPAPAAAGTTVGAEDINSPAFWAALLPGANPAPAPFLASGFVSPPSLAPTPAYASAAPTSGKTKRIATAANKGDMVAVRKLLAGASADEKLDLANSALIAASGGGHLALVEELLTEGANALTAALQQSSVLVSMQPSIPVIECLLSRGANPKGCLGPLLSNGFRYYTDPAGLDRVAKLMIDKGAEVTNHHTLINALLLPSHLPALYMLQAGAALRPDPELLQRCTKDNFKPVMELLLARGADPNTSCVRTPGEPFAYRANGITPLMSAFLNGSLACAETLLRAGADALVASQVSPGTCVTVLNYAKTPEAIALLSRYITDPVVRARLINWFDPPYKLTSLHGALISACTASVPAPPKAALRLFEVLVEAGGDLGVKDKEGRDLVEFAKQRGAPAALIVALTAIISRFQSKPK